MTHRHAAALLSAAFACTAAAQDPIEAQISAAVAEVDAARIEATVRKLCSFGTRHVLSRTDSDTEGTGAARRWLKAQYEAIAAGTDGRMTVRFQEEVVPCLRSGMPREVKVVNVIATLRGTTDPGRIYVVGGHYDSRNSAGNDGQGDAPGANDDGSGTAVALEVCRAMCDMEFPATLMFCAYDGEEHTRIRAWFNPHFKPAAARRLEERARKLSAWAIDEVVEKGEADAVALGRGMLWNPRWPWHAAAALGAEVSAPRQYWRSAPAGTPQPFRGFRHGMR